MEREKANCFRFIYLMVEVVPEILRFRLKQSYKNSNLQTLPSFLKETNVVHTLFHLFSDSSFYCCRNGCRIQRERPKGLSKEQWNILYDADSTKFCKKNPKYPNKICICCVTPKNIDEKVLDLSLLCLILNNCSNLMPNEKEAVQNIRELKNDHVSHKSSCRLSESDFLMLWEKAELYIKHLDSTNIYLLQRENLLKGPIDESLMQQYFVQSLDTISEIKIVHASIGKGNEDIKDIKKTVTNMNSILMNMQRQEPRSALDNRKRPEPTKCLGVSNEEDNIEADDYNMFKKWKQQKLNCLNLQKANDPIKEEAFDQDQTLVKYNLPVSVTWRQQINTTKSKRELHVINCCTKTGNALVFTERHNNRLTICYTNNTDIHQIPLTYQLNYITELESNTVAVSFRDDRTIQIINISTRSATSTINTSGYCDALSYNDNKLYVAVNCIIHVMDLTGKVIRTIPLPRSIDNIRDIAVDRDRLVSINSNSIYCWSLNRTLMWEFKMDEHQDLRRVTTDGEGNVYVTDYTTNSVVVVSDNGKQYTEILTELDGLDRPIGIYFDKREKILLVCNTYSGEVFLFDVKKNEHKLA